MKIVFLSNYFNHHQHKVSEELYLLTNGEYLFIEAGKMSEERKKLGYSIEKPTYVRTIRSKEDITRAVRHINDAEIVIVGSAPDYLIKERQKAKKLTFRYSERIYKDKYEWHKWPARLITFYNKFGRYRNTYLLCSSAFTYADYAKHFSYLNKAYKWGYFPETQKYDINNWIIKKKRNTIMWCGRFIDWKHPDDAIKVAKRLAEEGYDFCLNFVGMGPMESELRMLVKDWNLTNCVSFLGSMSPSEVRTRMEEAGIYLFTSDRKEGWGAVLNESMNSGCAVITSHALGATPYLVKDNENGLIYKSGDIDALYEKAKYLLDNPEEQRRLGENAYKTISGEWNAEVAAERLIELSQNILQGNKTPDIFKDGPCSRAKIIKDNWY